MPEKIEFSQEYEVYASLGEFPEDEQSLIKEAIEASKKSYSPYSDFKVGAALLLENGEILHGANQENASFPEGTCAEKVVFYKAATLEEKQKIKKIAVVALKGTEQQEATPCGGCRQVMLEYEYLQKEDIELIMLYAPGKWIKTKNMKSLLPFSFKL